MRVSAPLVLAVACLAGRPALASHRPKPHPPHAEEKKSAATPAPAKAPDDGLPPLDELPPDNPAPPPPPLAPPLAPRPAPPPPVTRPHLWRFEGAVGLELAGDGFLPTGGGMVAAKRRVVDAGKLAFDLGLRASYAPRLREVLVDSGGRSVPAAVFYAQTGDVSLLAATSFAPFPTLPVELSVEAGAGLALRAGHQKLIDRQLDASGAGLSTEVAAALGWQLSPRLAVGLRGELLSQPQPVRLDAPAMPTDLGALRAMVFLALAP